MSKFSYEEIRAVALDALSERVLSKPGRLDFYGFKDLVAKRLLAKDEGFVHPGVYASDSIGKESVDLFREMFWDLFRDGLITLGESDVSPDFPSFRLSRRGENIVKSSETYFFHDVSEFEKRVLHEVPSIDSTTLLYLKESLQAFRAGCLLSSSVMLGVAAENAFDKMINSFQGIGQYDALFKVVDKERQILTRINKFKDWIGRHQTAFSKKIREDLDTNFLAIHSIIRNYRNEAGHPTGSILHRDQAFTNIQLFIPFYVKVAQMSEYAKQNPS